MAAPRNFLAKRLNGTHMIVAWDPITLEEARGFVTAYKIYYAAQKDAGRRKRATESVSITEGTTTIIGGLDIVFGYSVTISAETRAGRGVMSGPVIAEGEWINK